MDLLTFKPYLSFAFQKHLFADNTEWVSPKTMQWSTVAYSIVML